MTDETEKPSLLVRITPPMWAAIFLGAGLAAGRFIGLPEAIRSPGAGGALFALGLIIAASGVLEFRRRRTEIMPTSKKNSAVVDTGPYRFTRNPMYLGMLLAIAGAALAHGNAGAFLAVPAFFFWVNAVSIPYEERKMERQFGEAFRAYKRRVRRWV